MEIVISDEMGTLAVSDNDSEGYGVFMASFGYDYRIKLKNTSLGFYFYFRNLKVIVEDFTLVLKECESPSYFSFENGYFTVLIQGKKFYINDKDEILSPKLICFENPNIEILEPNHNKDIIIFNNDGTITKNASNREYNIMKKLNIPNVVCLKRYYLYCEINMPIIQGVNLYNYISKFINMHSQIRITLYTCTTVGIDLISSNIVFKLCLSLIDFYERIQIFNSEGKYHNDLHMLNCIYNEETNKIEMIDYEFVSFDSPNSNYYDENRNNLSDLDLIEINIKYFLLCGCLSYDFYSLLKNNNLISNDDYDISMFTNENFMEKLKILITFKN